LLALSAIAALLVGGVVFPGRSQAASTFSASAGGEIVRASVRLVPALLAEEILDPGAVTAQASLTSFGESTAFASTPYPGGVPVSAPGLVDGLLGSTPGVPPELTQLVNVPDYPLIANSSFPDTPSSTVNLGPVSMDAQSRARESSATTGDGVNRTVARVSADDTTDIVTATATSTIGGVDLGPLVQLGGVRSTTTVTQEADGDLQRTTDFTVASFSVLGTQLKVTRTGIELAGINLPGGLGAVVDPVQQLLASLQGQGTSIRFVDAQETTDGLISAGLVIQSTFDTGINGIVATTTMTLGRTFANVSNEARPGLGDTTDIPTGSGDFGSGVEVGPTAGFDAGGALPSTGGGAVAPTRRGAVGQTERIRALTPDRTDAGSFYPMLALGGAVFVIGISLFRKIGVRSPWTS
jgi:hypothetical protein